MIERTPSADLTPPTGDGIAIIGMGCRLPGNVDSADAYWRLLHAGTDAISEIPRDRWNLDEYYSSDKAAPGKMYVRHGGFVDGVDRFDASFFGIAPREAEDLDPQQRILLEVAWESLEHAGIPPGSLRGSETGLFVGMSSDDFAANQWSGNGLGQLGTYTTLGIARSVAVGRIAYFLDLRGPVMQLDTSCSSSLVSVYQACQSLAAGQCQLALAGGVNMILSPATMVSLCRLKVLSPGGRCRAFDAAADGYVRGEGCGLVVLKPMRAAVRDGDRILAVIRAAAVNHDGASQSLTTPSGRAQQELMRKALGIAGIEGQQVTYVEAHGTGTQVGDPIELESLDAVYGGVTGRTEPLHVGTVKTNIGHLEAAAGIAGLMKAVLMLQHREIPASLHFARPRTDIPWEQMQLSVPTCVTPWPESDPCGLAAVSSFGISGTNAHVILQASAAHPIDRECAPCQRGLADISRALEHADHPGSANPTSNGAPRPRWHLLTLSAQTIPALRTLAANYADQIASRPEQSLGNICFTAATGRDHFAQRVALVTASRDELVEALRRFAQGEDDSSVVLGSLEPDDSAARKTAFLFTGQGTQYPGMGRDLYDSQPVFRAALARCDAWLRTNTQLALIDLLYGDANSASSIDQTAATQPVLFSLQFALVELWKSWGVQPDAVIGHSVGEYAAACAAGVFDLETGLELIAIRGRLMGELPAVGTMAVVMAEEGRVARLLEEFRGDVSIASMNGPETVVISGQRGAVQEVLARLTAEGVDVEALNTSNAGHCALVEPVLEPFRAVAAKFAYAPPRIEMISNVSGKLAADEVAEDSYWVRQIRAPVRFSEGINVLAERGCRTFVEIGPNPNLLAMGMGCLKRIRPRPWWVPSLAKGRNSWETMLYSLAGFYVRGGDIDWHGFYRPYECSRVSLPTYAFQRQSFPSRANGDIAAPHTAGKASHLPPPSKVAEHVAHLCAGLENESSKLTPRLDEIAIHFVISAIEQLGFPWQVGAEISEHELDAKIPKKHRPKVARVFGRLVEQGWLEDAGERYRVTKATPAGSGHALLNALHRESDFPECDLLGRAGPALAAIWQGKAEPLAILFPDGSTDSAVAFYSQAKLLAGYNRIAAEALRHAIAALPESSKLMVLEIGAGTGGLTTHLLPHVPAHRGDYLFTDLSPLFLHAAEARFGKPENLQTELLDISRSPLEQGFAPHSFDLVVAANVLHATPRLHETLRHVRQVLKPNGWLMLLEGANPPFWGDMVFTLIDGWWNFQDTQIRPDYPLMRRDAWCRVLADVGFAEIACLNDSDLQDASCNTLYLAQDQSKSSNEEIAVAGRTTARGADAQTLTGTSVAEGAASTPTARDQALANDWSEVELSAIVLSQAARVMRMTPEQIDVTQPLSELGLDSLMATELRAQLGHTLHQDLTLNTLQLRRSVSEIAQYINDQQVRLDGPCDTSTIPDLELEVEAPRAHLVPLQPQGAKTPLFFVPAGYGDLFAFHDIAEAMGMNQPVYGLQPASAKRVKTFRQMSVHRLVSAYIEEIKRVQPSGPYLLSGYSAGGIIVVELARELKRQGNDVGLLVIFDPPSHVPFWLDWFYVMVYRLSSATGFNRVVRRLHSRLARRLFHTVLDEGLRTHSAVIREHYIARYPGRITHFRATLSQSSLVSLKPMGPFWRRIAAEGTEVHWVPGTHYGLLRGRGAIVVVDELLDCLQRAEASELARRRLSPTSETP